LPRQDAHAITETRVTKSHTPLLKRDATRAVAARKRGRRRRRLRDARDARARTAPGRLAPANRGRIVAIVAPILSSTLAGIRRDVARRGATRERARRRNGGRERTPARRRVLTRKRRAAANVKRF